MELLTDRAVVRCEHGGRVSNVARQAWVRVAGAPLLVDDDPEGRTITGCPNIGATMKPCVKTLAVVRGYRDWIRVDGRRAVAMDLDGLTDGTPPGTVRYTVHDPGQGHVEVDR